MKKINGNVAAINAGTERAVSNEERLDNLLEMARQTQLDISPNNWTPMKLACEHIDKLRTLTTRQREVMDTMYEQALQQAEVIAHLSRPWWVKILALFQ